MHGCPACLDPAHTSERNVRPAAAREACVLLQGDDIGQRQLDWNVASRAGIEDIGIRENDRHGGVAGHAPRRVIARIAASMQPDLTPEDPTAMGQEVHIRYIVTTFESDAERLYEVAYCQCGKAESLIAMHKAQLASDRTSRHSATANQVRLAPHSAAFWLMHAVRAAILEGHTLAAQSSRRSD